MQSVPSLPVDPGLRLMVVMACIGILSLVIGVIRGAVKRDSQTQKSAGGPLLTLMIILSFGRKIAPAHPILMSSIVLWCAVGAHRSQGFTRWATGSGGAGLASAYLTGLLLF